MVNSRSDLQFNGHPTHESSKVVEEPTISSIRILICDPHPIVRKGVRLSLQEHADFLVAAECSQLSEISPLLQQLSADVIVLGHDVPLVPGSNILEFVFDGVDSGRVILLSSDNHGVDYGFGAISAGIRGIFYRHQPTELLGAAVREVHKGGLWFDRGVTDAFISAMLAEPAKREADSSPEHTLTMRQKRIVALVREGRSNKEIADKVRVSQATVAYELTNIYRKMGVTDRIQLLLKMQADKSGLHGQVKSGFPPPPKVGSEISETVISQLPLARKISVRTQIRQAV
jgi:two-component system nitrate/nitrite response regulator NarL